jgi:para-aminobenzoate synthetase component I
LTHATNTNCIFPVTNFTQLKNNVLNWANRFSTFCFLDNHDYSSPLTSVECVLGAGVRSSLEIYDGSGLEQLHQFISRKNSWLFGHLAYDVKNEIEQTSSSHDDNVGFSTLFFFEPDVLIRFNKRELMIETSGQDAQEILNEILNARSSDQSAQHSIRLSSRLGRQEYIGIIEELKSHILRGDCYEINFCQEFFAENVIVDPVEVYKNLSIISPNPFSALYRLDEKYLICASPERFLKKIGNKIVSQPIKGTSKRADDQFMDEVQKNKLLNSSKERSENVMVVDLVRNDLSKICKEGTVKVDELYGIYSFPQVHQMISTVSGTLNSNVSFCDIIRATFPMGSMTGAPKKKVMDLIEKYEKTKRGIFSGALGYITPEKNFDLNVVIRSIMYNSSRGYLSFQTGSGITFYCDAEKEWEECLLKAQAMIQVLHVEEEAPT